jgi:hypothetical protein
VEKSLHWPAGKRDAESDPSANSHDKTFPAGIIAGSCVFICVNLAFSGKVKLARKHTIYITSDLPRLVQGVVARLMERWHHQDTRLMMRAGLF